MRTTSSTVVASSGACRCASGGEPRVLQRRPGAPLEQALLDGPRLLRHSRDRAYRGHGPATRNRLLPDESVKRSGSSSSDSMLMCARTARVDGVDIAPRTAPQPHHLVGNGLVAYLAGGHGIAFVR